MSSSTISGCRRGGLGERASAVRRLGDHLDSPRPRATARARARNPTWSSTIENGPSWVDSPLSGPFAHTGNRTIGGGLPPAKTPADRIGAGPSRCDAGAMQSTPPQEGPCDRTRTSLLAPRSGARTTQGGDLGWLAFVVDRVRDRRRRRHEDDRRSGLGNRASPGRPSTTLVDAGSSDRATRRCWSRARTLEADDPQFDAAIARRGAAAVARCAVSRRSVAAEATARISDGRSRGAGQVRDQGRPTRRRGDRDDAAAAAVAAAQARAIRSSTIEAVRRRQRRQGARRGASWRTSGKAETLSLPMTLLILVVAFGALVAAGVPLLLALTAVMATMGLVGARRASSSRSTSRRRR